MFGLILTIPILFFPSQDKAQALNPLIAADFFKEKLCNKMETKALHFLEKQNKKSFIFCYKLALISADNERRKQLKHNINDIFFKKITKELDLHLISFYLDAFENDLKKLHIFFNHLKKACEHIWINKKQFEKGQDFINELSRFCEVLEINGFEFIQTMIQRIFICFLKSNDAKGLINIYPFCKKFEVNIPFEMLKTEVPNLIEDAKYLFQKNLINNSIDTLEWVLIIDEKNTQAQNLLNTLSKN
jgi:hypothetical protein